MANAKRPSAPKPKGANGLVHGNAAPFSPQKLEEIAPGGSVSSKGMPNSYLGGENCEKGTGDAKPVWP